MEYEIKNVKDFNLDHIFDCGQCFRWEKQEDGAYTGVALDKVIKISTKHNDELADITIHNCTENEYDSLWKNYLDMERDYSEIKEMLSAKDEILKKAASYGYGIRILKQDFWETMVSFIISQNNNIPRIKGCIESLCRSFGECLGKYEGREYFSFPQPEKFARLTVDDLSEAKVGYRAKYIIETAKQVMEAGGIESVYNKLQASENPIEELQGFCGIGPKVAACITLFGLGRMEAFPIDVWIKRVMNQLYDIDEADVKAMKSYAQEHFGEYGGIAQQYLFYYIRSL